VEGVGEAVGAGLMSLAFTHSPRPRSPGRSALYC
jgi:hypothetical protein